ncbi:MAG: hypothetical protein ACLS7Z_03735 [Christensenellales bacterium]
MALALSALLIAQPIMPMPGSGVNVAVILDASASMQMADGQADRRFARAGRRRARHGQVAMGRERDGGAGRGRVRVAADHVSGGMRSFARRWGVSCGWGAGDVAGAAALCQQMLDEGGISDVRLYGRAGQAEAEVVTARRDEEREPGALETSGSIYGTRLKPRCRAAEARM